MRANTVREVAGNSMDGRLAPFRRIVIKIGSSLLVSPKTGLNAAWLQSLADDIAALRNAGHEILIVSSGAIALGRGILGLTRRALKLDDSQAAAAAGQIALARFYAEALATHGLNAGQILLTLSDTEERRRYLNARATIDRLLKLGAVPIINENDTVATTEIRYGDNDRLAARVATMVTADLLILLSDVDGLYTAPPGKDPDARFIDHIEQITPAVEAMAGDAGTELSRGGMKTKIEAGRIATAGGAAMAIASGKKTHPVAALDRGERASWFAAAESPVTARKKWIGGQLELAGALELDAGAERALYSGKSLLPAGVRKIRGEFSRGDVVALVNETGSEIGRGIIAYDAGETRQIAGRKSADIVSILGYERRSELIHRDDMTLSPFAARRRQPAAADRDDSMGNTL